MLYYNQVLRCEEIFNPSVKFSGYIQSRWDHTSEEDADPSSEWDLKRVRTIANVGLNNRLHARVMIDLAAEKLLRDAYISFSLSKNLSIKAGQHKIPFSREELTSPSRLFLVDRGQTNKIFKRNRFLHWDIGASAQFSNNSGTVKLDIGVFNGLGINEANNNEFGKALAGRIVVNPVKNLEVAFGTVHNPVSMNIMDPDKKIWAHAYEADYNFVFKKWIFEGEYQIGNNWLEDPDISMHGFHQYILYRFPTSLYILNAFEPGIKFEYFDTNRDSSMGSTWYYLPHIGIYFLKYYRLQMNFVFERPEETNKEYITKFVAQLQFKF